MENILRRSALKAESTYQKLRKVVEVSLFVGSDETGAKVKGKKSWFWVWQTALVTYMLAACSRSKKVIEDTFPRWSAQRNSLFRSFGCSVKYSIKRFSDLLGSFIEGLELFNRKRENTMGKGV